MKTFFLRFSVLTCCLLLAQASARAAEAFLEGTIKNLQALEDAVETLAEAAAGKGEDAREGFRNELGDATLATLRKEAPWQFRVFFTADGQPALAWLVPVSDFEKFKGLEEGGDFLRGSEENRHQIVEAEQARGAVVVMRPPQAEALEGAALESLQNWEAADPVDDLVRVRLTMVPTVRMMALQGIATGRAMLEQQMQNQIPPDAPYDREQVMASMNIYFDLADAFFKGLRSLDLSLDLAEDELVVHEVIRAETGSDLAKVLSMPSRPADELAAFMDPADAFSVSMRLEEGGVLMEKFLDLTRTGMEMQGMEMSEEMVREMEESLQGLLPFTAVLNGSFSDGYQLSGFYKFPDRPAAEVYEDLLKMVEEFMEPMTGPDKIYRSYELERNAKTVEGLSVDVLRLVLNEEFAAFQGPSGEMLKNMWPEGRVEMEYAVEDDRILYAMGRPITAALQRPGAGKEQPLAMEASTVALMSLDIPLLIRQMAAMQGEESPEVKAAGKAMWVRVNLAEEKADVTVRFPLQVLRMFGEVNKQKP